MRRNFSRTAQALAVAVGCTAIVAGSTGVSAAVGATGVIRSHANWRCLDADLNTIAGNGTKVQLWDCNGWSNQKWIYDAISHTIYSLYNGRCLDADLNGIGANGTKAQLWDCNGWANQKWTV
jgi:hypothetical protein